MQKWPGCRGVIVTPEEWERRMDFPRGWTDLAHSATPSSPQLRNGSASD